MSDILEGPTATWLQCYTSNCIGESEVDQIISALKNDGLILDHNGTLRWRDFPDKPSVLRQPKKVNQQSTGKEDGSETGTSSSGPTAKMHAQESAGRNKTERAIFRPLGTIINAIVEVSLPNLSPSCRYKEEPYATDSEVSGSQHRIDGALRLIKSMSPPAPKRSKAATSDIAVSFEFKCEDEPNDISDNRRKALYSAFHALHSDCQRKHTYSVTIEDNHVSLWYFSRSHSAKSHEFDLLDVRTVVRALSALIFSTVEDLGYDANIRRISEWDEDAKEDRIRYVYRLDDRFFKTLKCRDEYDDLYIVGRATRVWEVIEVASFDNVAALPNAPRMILRDVWLEHDSDTEREIQKKIFERCDELGRNFPPENDARLCGVDDAPRPLLHHRLRDGSYKELFLTIEADYRGATSKPRAEGFTPAPYIYVEPVYLNQEAKRHGSDAQRALSSRTPSAPEPAIPSKLQADVPREYKPKQRNFVVYQERILFLISWMHRDVSSGNILFFNGCGKLSDLEYAKEFNLSVGGRSSDPKTGTQIFMAVELQTEDTIYKEISGSKRLKDYKRQKASSPPRIRHNFQHDLESIFWIMTWLVFTHIPGQDCADVAAKLFHSRDLRFLTNRHKFLTDKDICAHWLETLRSDLPPVLTDGLLVMRNDFHLGYHSRGRSIGDLSSYAPLYGQIRETLEAIAASVPRGTVRLVQPPPPKVDARSGYAPRTETLGEKMDAPEDHMLAPHKAASLKRARGASDADRVSEQSRAAKRSARG
ncbi:hypothetical protein BN946_scf184414.g3 [Trametes cinnabarina]|uniref:Fungal-type protein kinase domain-containing protein n=1 Tax=Pycnoporus cinnabarinus TaxID=5643 RepID=A0A060SQA7_PYCCI|nr:hypothetical protein BN946_scf184414.g3 [Trametes cinnabarina]